MIIIDKSFTDELMRQWTKGGQTAALDRIVQSGTTLAGNGREIPLIGHVSVRYARFLWTIVSMFQPQRVLEIGMANGISSAYIASAQRGYLQCEGAHVIIDPFQSGQWQNAGRALLQRLGIDQNVRVVEDFSICAMPQLEKQGERFDFVFIDGNHCMDYVLADVVAADRLLEVGGLLVFDDSTGFGVRMAIPYLDRYRTNLRRIRFDNALVYFLRETVGRRRRMSVYQKVCADERGADGI